MVIRVRVRVRVSPCSHLVELGVVDRAAAIRVEGVVESVRLLLWHAETEVAHRLEELLLAHLRVRARGGVRVRAKVRVRVRGRG